MAKFEIIFSPGDDKNVRVILKNITRTFLSSPGGKESEFSSFQV